MKKKSISFLMPGSGSSPSGGYKVIFEQANRLACDGYDVHIVYPIHTIITKLKIRNILGIIKRYFQGFRGDSYKATWFPLNAEIKEHKVFSLKYKNVPKTQFYCASSLETSYYLNEYPISSEDKIYYIQGYETWNVPEPYTSNSYKFKMKKIAIAPYLLEKVRAAGEDAAFIPNGFDFNEFGIDKSIEERNPHIAMMLYASNNDIKRCSDSIAALKIVKEKIPDLKVIMFGLPERPADLPAWFEYHQKPDRKTLRKLYNSASVFVAASRTEGMALPPAEAFICGCALCCTDIGGFGVYAIEGKTALLSSVFDYEKLAENINELMINNEKRIKFAKAGNELMKQYTWENAYKHFSDLLN